MAWNTPSVSPSSATEGSLLLRAAPIRAGERRKKCATRTATQSTQRLSAVRHCTSARAWAALWRAVLSPSALSTSVRSPIRSGKQNRPSEASGREQSSEGLHTRCRRSCQEWSGRSDYLACRLLATNSSPRRSFAARPADKVPAGTTRNAGLGDPVVRVAEIIPRPVLCRNANRNLAHAASIAS